MGMKHSKPNDTAADEVSQWLPLEYVYEKFVKANPQLGLKSGSWPLVNMRRHHAAELIERGVLRQLQNLKWLAHETRFADALFSAITRKGKGKAVAS